MITNDSRYTKAAHESASTHIYDEMGVREVNESNAVSEINRETLYLLTTGLASPPPRQYMAKETDNMQLLAYRVLQDPTRWWVIADANPHVRYPLDLPLGETLYLPE